MIPNCSCASHLPPMTGTEAAIIGALVFGLLAVAALTFDTKLREELWDWILGRDPFDRSWTAREARRWENIRRYEREQAERKES